MCRAAPLPGAASGLLSADAGLAAALPVREPPSQARIQCTGLRDTGSPQTGITPDHSRGWARGRQKSALGPPAVGWRELQCTSSKDGEMAPRRDHCPCLTVPRTSQEGHQPVHCPYQPVPYGGLEKAPGHLTRAEGSSLTSWPLPRLLFLPTPHSSVGRALRHQGEGRLRTFPGQSSEAWVERDQKCIVTNAICVSVDFATGRIQSIRNRPRPASRLSHHLRYKARWRAPRPAHGEEGQWAQHRLGPLSPPRSDSARPPAPPRRPAWGAPLGRESPSPAPQQPQQLGRKRRRTRGGRSDPQLRRLPVPALRARQPRVLPTAAPGCTGRRPAPNFRD